MTAQRPSSPPVVTLPVDALPVLEVPPALLVDIALVSAVCVAPPVPVNPVAPAPVVVLEALIKPVVEPVAAVDTARTSVCPVLPAAVLLFVTTLPVVAVADAVSVDGSVVGMFMSGGMVPVVATEVVDELTLREGGAASSPEQAGIKTIASNGGWSRIPE